MVVFLIAFQNRGDPVHQLRVFMGIADEDSVFVFCVQHPAFSSSMKNGFLLLS
jgi:hypothetical protein